MRQNQIFGSNLKLLVPIQPNIGLERDVRFSIVNILNTTLADEAVLTMKTRSAFWNVNNSIFFEFHHLFGQQLRQLNRISDRIAERVCMLGGSAISSFAEFLLHTRLEEQYEEKSGIMNLLADHEASIRYLREDARKCFEEYEDRGTHALLVRLICWHEKTAWIFRSHIEPEMPRDQSP